MLELDIGLVRFGSSGTFLVDDYLKLINYNLLDSGIAAHFRAYGDKIKDPFLTRVATFLYKASRADSTRKA